MVTSNKSKRPLRAAAEHAAQAETELAEARFVPGLPPPVRRLCEEVERRARDLREILVGLCGARDGSGRLRKGTIRTPVEAELERLQPQLGLIKAQLCADERQVVSWLVGTVRVQQEALAKATAALAGAEGAEREFQRVAGKLLCPTRGEA